MNEVLGLHKNSLALPLLLHGSSSSCPAAAGLDCGWNEDAALRGARETIKIRLNNEYRLWYEQRFFRGDVARRNQREKKICRCNQRALSMKSAHALLRASLTQSARKCKKGTFRLCLR